MCEDRRDKIDEILSLLNKNIKNAWNIRKSQNFDWISWKNQSYSLHKIERKERDVWTPLLKKLRAYYVDMKNCYIMGLYI